MKTWIHIALLILATSAIHAQELPIQKLKPSIGFVLGGDLPVSWYSGRDNRLQFGLDLSGTYAALPVTMSFGQDMMILGVKPAVHFPLALFSAAPGLSLMPGLGLTLNWWNYTGSLPVDADVIELGANFGFSLRYDSSQTPLYVTLTPFSMDMNFWRYFWASSGSGSGSRSNSKLGVIYNLLLEMGFRF